MNTRRDLPQKLVTPGHDIVKGLLPQEGVSEDLQEDFRLLLQSHVLGRLQGEVEEEELAKIDLQVSFNDEELL